jgi:hypothetical protein
MGFTENMYTDYQLDVLARECEKTIGLRGLVIEFGCWEGRSTAVLAVACAPDILIAVDTWTGSAFGDFNIDIELGCGLSVEDLKACARERDIFATFKANIAELTAGNVQPIRADHDLYLDRLRTLPATRIKFVHLDGAHDYEAVHRQITALKPLMVPGGIICGHDFHHEPVERAVRELCLGFIVDDNVWSWTA